MEKRAESNAVLISRSYSKEELLNRDKFIESIRIKNSDVFASEVNMGRAVDKAVDKMQKQIAALPR
jgi:ribosome-associated translation inhibitor RaiA